MSRLEVGVETGARKVYAWALDWPGWCRGAKDREGALAALLAAADRYLPVIRDAGLRAPAASRLELVVVDEVQGSAGTDFGIPYTVAPSDHRAVTPPEADRLASLVEAAWSTFDRVAAAAPETLRKGPRGGGRDRDKVVDHVLMSDHAYAREIGLRLPEGSRQDRPAVDAGRAAVVEVLRQPSDGAAIAGRRWPPRYAARRIAWHALDHAWEIEDRTEPV